MSQAVNFRGFSFFLFVFVFNSSLSFGCQVVEGLESLFFFSGCLGEKGLRLIEAGTR